MAGPLAAQQPDEDLQPVRSWAGIQLEYARPVGEFADYVEHGGGLNANFVWPVTGPESVFALRADGGFVVYGSETKRVCFGGGVGCRIQLDLTTTNSIAYGNVGPQLMLHSGPVRPYANAAVGFSFFSTSSSVEGSSGSEPFAQTSNFSDITLAWAAGGGVLVPLSSGKTPVSLDIGVRYHGNGEVEYLKQGDIQDNPDGSITFNATRSEANLLTFQLGVSIGLRPGATN